MVWLDICDDSGNTLYLDVHHVSRRRVGRRWQHAVSGICGNGLAEVSVLIEPGVSADVTYVDFSTGSCSRHQLLSGVDAVLLDSELIAAAQQYCGLANASAGTNYRSPHALKESPLYVNESRPVWQATG